MGCCGNQQTLTNVGVKDPVCGMIVDPAKAAGHSEYLGTTYFFCSTGCKHKFDAAPEHFVSPSPNSRSEKVETDPVCGMQVNASEAAATAVHRGQTFYFCSKGCETKFNADPQKYLIPKEDLQEQRPPAGSSTEC